MRQSTDIVAANADMTCLLAVFLSAQEEDEVDSAAVAPGTAPTMSAAKAAKSVAEREARIAVRMLQPFWN